MATIVEVNGLRCIQPSSSGIRQELEVYRRTIEFDGHESAVNFMKELRALCEKYPAMDSRLNQLKADDEGTFSSSVV